MKRLLSILLLFVVLQTYAQVSRDAVFDFNHPLTLVPSVTPSSSNGYIVPLDQYTFRNQGVTLTPYEVGLHTYISSGETTYSMYVIKGGSFKISVGKEDLINTITFEGSTAALRTKNSKGKIVSRTEWSANGEYLHEVEFENPISSASTITKVVVNYTTKSDVLAPTSCSVDGEVALQQGNNTNQPAAFSFMTLTFVFPVYTAALSSVEIVAKMADGGIEKPTVQEASGQGTNTITLTLDKALEKDCDVSVTIPSGVFTEYENGSGFVNKDLTYSFSVYEPRTSFNPDPDSFSPAMGKVEVLGNIQFQFSGDVKFASTGPFYLMRNGEVMRELHLDIVPNDPRTVQIDMGVPFTTDGTYTLDIPEGTIHNAAMGNARLDRWNEAFTIKYTIGEGSSDPGEDPHGGEGDNYLNTAIELLANEDYQGVGYPLLTGEGSRAALQALVSAEEPATEEQLKAAIEAFYNDPEVTLPSIGKWYYIVGVNSGNRKVYLSYAASKVSLTQSVNDAAPFLLSSLTDKVAVFETPDGKFLHALTGNPNYYGIMDNESPTKYNMLTLTKLVVPEVDPAMTFGKFSIAGVLENTVDGKEYSTISAIDYNNLTVVNVPTTELFFNANASSAFIFEETTSPEAVKPTATLASTVVTQKAETILLTIGNVKAVSLKDASKAKLYKNSHRVNTTAAIIKEGNADCQFLVQLSGLTPGEYELVLPVGTFDYSQNDRAVTDQEFSLSFTIKTSSEENFQYTFKNIVYLQRILWVQSGRDFVEDTELNDFVLFVNIDNPYSGIVADPTKVVSVEHYYSGKQYATGHLYPYEEFETDYGYTYTQAVKLVLDKPIEYGDVEEGFITYHIPKATIGDLNFGRWLNDHNSVLPEDCIVNNDIWNLTVQVNNQKASGITDLKADEKNAPLYDLQGRKVTGVLKSGIYIKNGKKVYIK